MAWIATEGNAFNHGTDRVSDLDLLEKEERNKKRNLKPQIEHQRYREKLQRQRWDRKNACTRLIL